jgi:tRNA(Arg) A34 adenosine deaminase TadA
MTDTELMRLAIKEARRGIAKGQTPFGACIARDGAPIARSHNRVWANTDITAHAEIVAIRAACRRLGGVDLSGCVIYSTTEPCPMCFSACHWARISKIIFGARIEDAQNAGFSELTVSNEQMKRTGRSPIEVQGGLLRDETMELFREWGQAPDRRSY